MTPTTPTGKRLLADFRGPKAYEMDLPWCWLDENDILAIEQEAVQPYADLAKGKPVDKQRYLTDAVYHAIVYRLMHAQVYDLEGCEQDTASVLGYALSQPELTQTPHVQPHPDFYRDTFESEPDR